MKIAVRFCTIPCFILFFIIVNSNQSDQDVGPAVGDAYTLLSKAQTICEMKIMVVGSKLVDYYNSYDEHTDRYVRMTNDYFMNMLGFAYWMQSQYIYNHLRLSSNQQFHDRFQEINAIQRLNGWHYDYSIVLNDHVTQHRGIDSNIGVDITASSSHHFTSPADHSNTGSSSTSSSRETTGYQYSSLRDKWIYFLGDSTLHQVFHTFLRIDHG